MVSGLATISAIAFAVAAETWGIFSIMVNSIASTFDINAPPYSFSSVSFTKGYLYGTYWICEVRLALK